jgi:hypothetical protein
MREGQRIDRRSYLTGLALGGTVTAAGCLGALDAPEDGDEREANGERDNGNGDAPSDDGTADDPAMLDADSQATTQFLNEAKRDASALSTWRDYRTFWVEATSQSSTLKEEPPHAVNRVFQNTLKNIPDGMHTVLFFELGTTEVLATTDPRFEGRVLEDNETPWIPDALRFESDKEVNVSDPYRESGTPVVAFVTRIRDRAGAGLAALAGTQNAVSPKDGDRFTTVVDGTGTIVIDQRDVEFVGQQYGDGATEAVVERGAAGESGILAAAPIADELDGEYLAGFAPVDGIDWTVVLHTPRDTVLEESAES